MVGNIAAQLEKEKERGEQPELALQLKGAATAAVGGGSSMGF